MNRGWLYATLVLALAGLFPNGGLPAARSQGDTPRASDFSKLSLKISAPKEEVFQSEPIPVPLELSDETGSPVKGHTALDFSLHRVKLFVGRGGGEMTEIKELSPSRERVGISPREIAPGERHRSLQLLTLKLGGTSPAPASTRYRPCSMTSGGRSR